MQRKRFGLFLHITSVCRLSYLCTLRKQFDEFRCRLAGTFVGSKGTLYQMGFLTSSEIKDFGVKAPARTCNCMLQPNGQLR